MRSLNSHHQVDFRDGLRAMGVFKDPIGAGSKDGTTWKGILFGNDIEFRSKDGTTLDCCFI